MECIELKRLIFHSFHGVEEQEQKKGNTFRIDLKIYLDLKKAIESDNLEDTINYSDIYKIIKDEMSIPSKLIEHVAGRIVRKIKHSYPDIIRIKIRLAKINPSIDGEIQEAAVIINE